MFYDVSSVDEKIIKLSKNKQIPIELPLIIMIIMVIIPSICSPTPAYIVLKIIFQTQLLR